MQPMHARPFPAIIIVHGRVLSSGGGRGKLPPQKFVSDNYILSQTSHNLHHLSSQSAAVH